jgi:hypothetical protein
MEAETAKQMYDNIVKIFQQDTDHNKHVLLQEFYNFKFNNAKDVIENISSLKVIVSKLNSLKSTIDEGMLIVKILTILPTEFKTFTTAWELTPISERKIENLISRLLIEEMKLTNESKEVAFKTENKNRKCYICKKFGHMAKTCRQNNNKFQYNKQCKYCKKYNHPEEKCYFKNSSNKKYNNNKGDHVSFMSSHYTNQNNYEMIVDSGCTSHMVNNKNMLSDIKDKKCTIYVAKENETMNAIGEGKIMQENYTLNNVLLVPSLSKNLLSVRAITDHDGKVIFDKHNVIIQKDNREIIQGYKNDRGLYTIEINQNIYEAYLVEWHRKMGHIGFNNLRKLEKMAVGINIKKEEQEYFCEICAKAKQTRLPFKTERERASRPLQIIHTDVMGPISPKTWDGYSYVLTLLDDYTHFTKIYLMKYKSETFNNIKHFANEVENMHNLKISKIRCDNGGEYKNNNFQSWCREKGIIIDYTVPYSPQLNGKAERLNRTLMEKARALIFDSKLNKEMWGEAIYTSTYLTNRSPSETIGCTPAEMWYNRKPNLSNIKLFGSVTYLKNLQPLKKLDERCKKFILVGYAPVGYRLWDPIKRKIIIGRDVIINEITNEEYIENCKVNTSNKEEKQVYFRNVITHEIASEESTNEEEKQLSHKESEIQCEDKNLNDSIDFYDVQSTSTHSLENTDEESENTDKGNNMYFLRNRNELKKPKKMDDYVSFLNIDEILKEPISYEEAINSEDSEKWKNAMNIELRSLMDNETWEEKIPPKDCEIIDTKWIFKIKKGENGIPIQYKARLVARGFQQKTDYDLSEIYAPVAKLTTFRILLAVANEYKMIVQQMDVKSAFLNGDIHEEVYLHKPEGMKRDGKILKLKKSLYGLKSSPKNWNDKLNDVLSKEKFIRSQNDYCLYTRINKDERLYILVYVDDILIIGSDINKVESIKYMLSSNFEMKDMGDVSCYLGININQNLNENIIEIDQKRYLEQILEKYGMDQCKPIGTPMDPNTKLEYFEKPENIDMSLETKCRQLIGSLMYAAVGSRPDLCAPVNILSRFQSKPCKELWNALKRVLRYIKGTLELKLVYEKYKNGPKLVGYVDADWGRDTEDRKSTSGYIFKIFQCAVSWCSRKQACTALSSTEAEYIALSQAICEGLWIKKLLLDLKFIQENEKIVIMEDNQSTIYVAKGTEQKRLKHIDIKYHFIKDHIEKKEIDLKYINTELQEADILTKPVGKNILDRLLPKIGMI